MDEYTRPARAERPDDGRPGVRNALEDHAVALRDLIDTVTTVENALEDVMGPRPEDGNTGDDAKAAKADDPWSDDAAASPMRDELTQSRRRVEAATRRLSIILERLDL